MDKRRLSTNALINDQDTSSAPSGIPEGHFRYLSPDQLGTVTYDCAIICYRRSPPPSGWCSSQKQQASIPSASTPGSSKPKRDDSPLFSKQEASDIHRGMIDSLCSHGLNVDAIDGGHSGGDMTSDYLILLIRGAASVIQQYSNKLRQELWIRHGNVRDVQQFEDSALKEKILTPAERIELVDIIIRQGAKLNKRHPWIKSMFPLHDSEVTDALVQEWIAFNTFGRMEVKREEFLETVRSQFGEKVAYYFTFVDIYNRSLIPLAFAGVLVWLVHKIWGTTTYMQLLPLWGFIVAVIWSFAFQLIWDRKNSEMQFLWGDRVKGEKQIEHARDTFYGEPRVNHTTGRTELFYPGWKRIPKYLCVALFMVIQICIMLFCVAIWITIYESIKVHFPDGGLFTVQWWLILLEGIVFGLFVDVFQWSFIVMKVARYFTEWENYETEEKFERALIRKLFLMDFLNYYTWFFLLAFVYVLPTFGDTLTNWLNHIVYKDPWNCCFGPHVDTKANTCITCPSGIPGHCQPCHGIFTFDRRHVDLGAMFVTPIVVTQSLNMLLAVLMPVLVKKKETKARAEADAKAAQKVKEKGGLQILGSLDYAENTMIENKTHQRYLEYSAEELERLDAKARDIIFEGGQPCYDPYDDFHVITVQFGFTVMFSILWPLMPLACLIINAVKMRADGYRLCRTLQRPLPRRSNGIGDWRRVIKFLAYFAILINIALICISTGCIDFFVAACVNSIETGLKSQGKTLIEFTMGPDFSCVGFTTRLATMMLSEHVVVAMVLLVLSRVSNVPSWVRQAIDGKEFQFKHLLLANASVFASNGPSAGRTGPVSVNYGDNTNLGTIKAMKIAASEEKGRERRGSFGGGSKNAVTGGSNGKSKSARESEVKSTSGTSAAKSPLLHSAKPVFSSSSEAKSTRSRIRSSFAGLGANSSPDEKLQGLSGVSTKSQIANAWDDE